MKFRPISFAVIFSLLPIIAFTLFEGCKKDTQPFGVNAPLGFDFPTGTPTPAVGAINAYIQDGGEVGGVTVVLTDPSSKSTTVVSSTYGPVAFNPYPILAGVYTVTIPTQGKYYLSSAAITEVTNGPAASVTFQGGVESISLVSSAPQSYTVNNSSFIFTLNYNSNVPVYPLYSPISITLNSLPSQFLYSTPNLILGAGVTTAPVTISKNNCYVGSLPLTWTCTNFSSTFIFPYPFSSLQRGYSVPVVVNSIVSATGSYPAKDTFSFSMVSSNDCNDSYSLGVSLVIPSTGNNFYNGTYTISNSSTTAPVSFAANWLGQVACYLTLTTPDNHVLNGNYMPGGTGTTAVLNTSY